jgi:hypothetical protein
MSEVSGNEKLPGMVYVAELAAILDRSIHTIRTWDYDRDLPRGCYPTRDHRGWRYWTPAQVDQIVRWVEARQPQSENKLERLRAIRNRSFETPTDEREHTRGEA